MMARCGLKPQELELVLPRYHLSSSLRLLLTRKKPQGGILDCVKRVLQRIGTQEASRMDALAILALMSN